MKNLCILFILMLVGLQIIHAQDYWKVVKDRPATLGLQGGYEVFETQDLVLKLVKSSQTVAALSPKNESNFDFTPGSRLDIRDKDSLYHLGDINFRIRKLDGTWKSYSTAWQRVGIEPLEVSGAILAAADLSKTLPNNIPLRINRYYEKKGGDLVMRFEITNTSESVVEIGALGIPMIFDNILEGKSLDEAHAQNVFYDPYMGQDAGYLEVKRLSGKGPVLLVLPHENMPFEAYRPLLDDLSPRSIVFEGFHEWMPHSKSYAENEWKKAEQWNKPTSARLEPGATKNIALKFVLADKIQHIEQTLFEKERPVAIGIPGYVVPQDVKALLFLKYINGVKSLEVYPEGALEIKANGKGSNGHSKFEVQGKKWGRARLTITYTDGLQQTVHYKVIKPEGEVVKSFGHFLTTEQWFDNQNDPFQRNPSVISYDYEEKKKVTQDGRVWIAGLSDEGGAASWLGAIMKQLIQPDRQEVKKLQHFIDETLWGVLQYRDGKNKYGVKRSVFYYEPEDMPIDTYREDIDYTTWAAWKKEKADSPDRSYNYPHVADAHWVMYRLARYYKDLVDNRTWDWYLKNAHETVLAMTELAPQYAQFGQMEGTVFLLILEDLKREGYTEMAKVLEEKMKARAEHWRSLNYPFGSEMPWDSTGQEEVYMWSDYFGFDEKAEITLNAILAYMPTLPHWAYNGSARRYWDFLYAGKLSRVERQLHHYGSGLNAIPVLDAYRENPDLHLLRVGYGGVLGTLSNITEDGFGPAAFHSFPSTMKIDGLSGDFGSGFFGYAVNNGTYIVNDGELGWLAFGGNLMETADAIIVELTTAAKNGIYFAPEKLWITMDAGKVEKLVYNKKTDKIEITLGPGNEFTSKAYVRVNKELGLPLPKIRGAYTIDLDSKNTVISFSP